MMKTAEIFSLKTNERIEFNPQENLLGKTVGRPWSPLLRGQGMCADRRFR
jgi:hypothetical protein